MRFISNELIKSLKYVDYEIICFHHLLKRMRFISNELIKSLKYVDYEIICFHHLLKRNEIHKQWTK
jgi:hypothetical protein